MTAATVPYRRLPGRSRSWRTFVANARSRIYQGPDHLLLIQTVAYTESCKRFYYKDIQAFDIRKTSIGRALNILWGFLAALTLGLGIVLETYFAGSAVYVSPVLVLALVGLAYNMYLGPTCKTRIYTAVQIEELSSLSRLRTARKVVHWLSPIIDAVQGQITQEELDSVSDDVLTTSRATSPLFDIRRLIPKPPDSGTRHAVFFALTLAEVAFGLLTLAFMNGITQLLGGLISTASLAALIVALTRQRTHEVPIVLRKCAWAGLVGVLAFLPVSVIYGAILAIRYQMSHPGVFARPEDMGMQTDPFFIGITIVHAIVFAIISTLGLYHWQRLRNASHEVTPPAPPEASQP